MSLSQASTKRQGHLSFTEITTAHFYSQIPIQDDWTTLDQVQLIHRERRHLKKKKNQRKQASVFIPLTGLTSVLNVSS